MFFFFKCGFVYYVLDPTGGRRVDSTTTDYTAATAGPTTGPNATQFDEADGPIPHVRRFHRRSVGGR
jgi:hypothetical protein